MYCDRCDTKMRPYELDSGVELHSCPKCGHTHIRDTSTPHDYLERGEIRWQYVA